MTQPSQKSFHSQKKNKHDPEEEKLLVKILVPIALVCATAIILVSYFFGTLSTRKPATQSSQQPSPYISTLPEYSYQAPVIPAQDQSPLPFWENIKSDYIRFYPFRNNGNIGLGLSSNMALIPIIFMSPKPTAEGYLNCANPKDQGIGDALFQEYTINSVGFSYDNSLGLQIWFWQYDQNQGFIDDILAAALKLPNNTLDGGTDCSGWVLSYQANNLGFIISSESNGLGKGYWLIVRGDTLGRTPDYYDNVNLKSGVRDPEYWWCLILARADGISNVIQNAGLQGLTDSFSPNTFQTAQNSSQIASNIAMRISQPSNTQDCFNPNQDSGGAEWVSCSNIGPTQIYTNACKNRKDCTEDNDCEPGQSCIGWIGDGSSAQSCQDLDNGASCVCMPDPYTGVEWQICSAYGATPIPSLENYSHVQTKYWNVNSL
jgi:hypothetical protein